MFNEVIISDAYIFAVYSAASVAGDNGKHTNSKYSLARWLGMVQLNRFTLHNVVAAAVAVAAVILLLPLIFVVLQLSNMKMLQMKHGTECHVVFSFHANIDRIP